MDVTISAGDRVRLTAEALFRLSRESPATFGMLHTLHRTEGVVRGFNIPGPEGGEIIVDFGDDVNRVYGSHEGVAFQFRAGSINRTVELIPPEEGRLLPTAELFTEIHVGRVGAPPDDDFDGPDEEALMSEARPAPAPSGPLEAIAQLARHQAQQPAVPLRVSVAISIMREFMGLKQYAIMQDVHRGPGNMGQGQIADGDEWKQGTEYDAGGGPQRIELEFNDPETSLYAASMLKIQRWLEQDDE